MSWWEYVVGIAGTDAGVEIAKAVAVDQSTVSRWKTTNAPGKAENVARLARAYKRPVLEAFIAAGFLTEQEAKVRPSAAPDFTRLSNDELLELVRARMAEEVTGNAEHPAANTVRRLAAASGGATTEEADEASAAGARARAKQEKARSEMKKRDD